MIGPTSETGQAMLQSLTQQINQGMPVDQAIQYVKSQAAVGVAPLVDLYALLNQFQRMKQPPQQPPMGGTIKQQLDSLEMMNRGLGAPMQASPNQSQMMAQGLGGLNAGAMENPGFAGGGVVAFAEGSVEPIRAANVKQDMPKSWEEIYARAQQGDEVSIEMLRKERERNEALEKETQTGRYAPSLTMKQAQLEKQKAALETDPAERAALDEQAYWGDVAGYAAESGTREKKGPTFLTSLAMAQKAKAERARTAAEKKKEAQKNYDAAEVAEAQAKEALRKGDLDTAQKKADEAKTLRKEAVKGRIERTEQEQKDVRQSAATMANTREAARLRREAEEANPLFAQRAKIAGMKRTDPGYDEEVEKLRDIENASGRDYSSTSVNQQILEVNKRIADAIAAGDEEAVARLTKYRNSLGATGPANVPAPNAPPVGTVKNGYRFKGGVPSDPKNWEKVGP